MSKGTLETITQGTSLGFLSGALVKQFVKKRDVDESDKIKQIRLFEKIILGVASGQYIITINMPRHRLQRWRYADWIVTTPLLLKTFHNLAEEKGFEESFIPALVFNILMIYSGYYAEFVCKTERSKQVAYFVGMVALVLILYYVQKWNDYLVKQGVDTGRLSNFFYIGWSFYGVNFMNPNPALKQSVYNILDLVNKGLYSIHLDEVISKL